MLVTFKKCILECEDRMAIEVLFSSEVTRSLLSPSAMHRISFAKFCYMDLWNSCNMVAWNCCSYLPHRVFFLFLCPIHVVLSYASTVVLNDSFLFKLVKFSMMRWFWALFLLFLGDITVNSPGALGLEEIRKGVEMVGV